MGVIGIYENTSGGCMDAAAWHIEQKILTLSRNASEPTLQEFTLEVSAFGQSLHCLAEAVELLKAKGWRITKHFLAGNKVFFEIEI